MGTKRMNISQQMALLSVINRYRTQDFKWGEYDCNTFVVECYDAIYKKNSIQNIRFHYNSKRTALEFAKSTISHSAWLSTKGYVKQPEGTLERNGDIAVQPSRAWATGYICFEGVLVGMVERRGLAAFDFDSITNKEIWRK